MVTNPQLRRHAGLVRLFKSAVWLLMKCLGPVRVRGAHQFPQTGGVLIVGGNHRAELDAAIVQFACNRPIRFLGKKELFDRPMLGWFIRLFRPIPVKQKSADIEALKTAINALKNGEVVMIFAEGRINRESSGLLEFQGGAALIARKSGCQVVTCFVDGTASVWPTTSVVPAKRSRITVMWGESCSYDQSGSNEEVTAHLRSNITQLGRTA